MQRVTIPFEGTTFDFDLDAATKRWTAVEAATAERLDEGDFPLVAHADAKRYELYDDGTYAEVET